MTPEECAKKHLKKPELSKLHGAVLGEAHLLNVA